ncbi:MAG: Rieske 2Fe-2S domain-containing protein [Pseudobdellovibrionaceae bacterium]
MKTLKDCDGDLINHWYILALENEVPIDRPVKRFLYDISYVLFRDKNGTVAVLQDKCLHRGAQLSLGTVDNGEVRCPYHGWKFNSEGRVTEVPSDGPQDEAEKQSKQRNWCVNKVPVVTQDGCVWIWPGDKDQATAAPDWRFPEYGNKSVTQYFMTTDFDNEVTHLIQNFMDVPHTVFVHSKWFRNRALLKVPVQIDVGSARVKVTYNQPNDSIGFTERILNPSGDPMIHTDEFIFPNLTRVDYKFGKRFFIINSQCSPISRYKTRVYTWIAYDIGWVSPLLKKFMQFYTRKVIQQDVDIMKNQGDNLKDFENMEFKSTQADELHIAIERMRSSGAMDRNEPSSLNYTREREFWI